MEKEIIHKAFQKEMERLRHFATNAQRATEINAYLRQFNWVFVHPYLQGFNINQLERMMKEQSGTEEAIYDLFVAHCYDLQRTAYYIDGYYKERPSLKPFCLLIDQSVMLCLQRDFAGAINVLIPVIEGAIRHFLTTYENKQKQEIMKKEKLIQVFRSLQERVRNSHRSYYQYYPDFHDRSMRFDENQVKLLTNKAVEFYDHWFAIIADYFSNNLYLDTKGNSVPDQLNRHAILHGFDTNIYYSLENYLRLFHCLHFLSWAFGVALPGISALPTLNETASLDKWKAYEKIKLAADLTWRSKQAVFTEYPEYKALHHRNIPPSLLGKKLSRLKRKNLEQKFAYLDKVFAFMRMRMAQPGVVGVFQPPFYDSHPSFPIRLLIRLVRSLLVLQQKTRHESANRSKAA